MITKNDIEKYFIAEKQAGLVLLIIGIIAILIALTGLLILKTNTWKGMALPFLLIGIIELAVGYNVYKKADALRISNVYALDMNPGKLTGEEIPRIMKVKKSFSLILAAEALLLLAGFVLMLLFKTVPDKAFLYGIGIGLTIQAAIALGFDIVAKNRTVTYHMQLQTLVKH